MGVSLTRLREQVQELVAQREARRDIAEFARYADDPIGFFVDVLRCSPWEAQEQIALAVRDHERVVVRSANGCGKGWTVARLLLWWAYARQGIAIVTAPTMRQLRITIMRELRAAWTRADDLPGSLYEDSLRVDDSREAGVYAFTSNTADRWQGAHAPNLLIVVDEAQGCEAPVFEAAMACQPTRVLVQGNPLYCAGDFYRLSKSKEWHAIRIAVSDHPNISGDGVSIAGGPTKEWVEYMRGEYFGTGVWTARVEGEFPETTLDRLVTRSWLNAAADRWESGALEHLTRDQDYTLGLDVARSEAGDKNALSVVHGPIVRRLESWTSRDLVETADRVIKTAGSLARWQDDRPRIVVDAATLGGGVVDVLRSRRWRVTEYLASRNPMLKPHRFLNLRAESFWRVRELLREDKVALPRDEELFEDLLATDWFEGPRGLIQIVAKDDIRDQLGRSPDRGDSVAMALYFSTKPPSIRAIDLRKLFPDGIQRLG